MAADARIDGGIGAPDETRRPRPTPAGTMRQRRVRRPAAVDGSERRSLIYGSRLTETLCSFRLRNLSGQKMQHRARKSAMALTADLVARVERVEPDPGPTPGQEYLSEA